MKTPKLTAAFTGQWLPDLRNACFKQHLPPVLCMFVFPCLLFTAEQTLLSSSSCLTWYATPLAGVVNCVVSDWIYVGICTKTCGGGKQTQTRTVTTPALNGGSVCPVLSQEVDCNTQACPGEVKGGFVWSNMAPAQPQETKAGYLCLPHHKVFREVALQTHMGGCGLNNEYIWTKFTTCISKYPCVSGHTNKHNYSPA
jgi:Spondin-like TSP1 domain